MSIRAKTKKRLLILSAILILITGGGVAAVYIVGQHQKAALVERHDDGMKAAVGGIMQRAAFYLEEKEVNALKAHLSPYLEDGKVGKWRASDVLSTLNKYHLSVKDDMETQYAFAISRIELPLEGAKHIREALSYLSRIADHMPSNEAGDLYKLLAEYELLERVLPLTKDWHRIVKLSQSVLKKKPSDKRALNRVFEAHVRLSELTKAREYLDQWKKAYPNDPRPYIQEIALAIEKGKTAGDELVDKTVMELAEKYYKQKPDDPRHQLVMAFGYVNVGKRVDGAKMLAKVASQKPPKDDPQFPILLIEHLDRIGLFEQSMRWLDAYAPKAKDPVVKRRYLMRLWEAKRLTQLKKMMKSVDLESDLTRSEILVFSALMAHSEKRLADRDKIIETLAGRERDPTSKAWLPIFENLIIGDPSKLSLKKIEEVLGDARKINPNDPYIRFRLGQLYLRMDEKHKAMEEFTEIRTKMRYSWSAPYYYIAQIEAANRHHARAALFINEALKRNPKDIRTLISWIRLQRLALDNRSGTKPKDVQKFDNQIMSVLEKIHAPDSDLLGEPQTLGVYIGALVRSGKRADAIKVLEAVMKKTDKRKPTASTYINVAQISLLHKLGLEEKAFAAAEGDHGLTVQVAYARAKRMVRDKNTKAAVAFFEKQVKRNLGKGPNIANRWKLAWAKFLDEIGDERAATAWKVFADENKKLLSIQNEVLRSRWIRKDPAYMQVVVDRLRELGARDGISAKLAEVALMLSQNYDVEENAQNARKILVEILEKAGQGSNERARLMLAQAYYRMGNLAAAISQLERAATVNPDNLGIQLELVDYHIARGNAASANAKITTLLKHERISRGQKIRVASMVARLGDVQRAIRMLETLDGDKAPPPNRLLAQLYFYQNDIEKAEKIYRQLIKNPNVLNISEFADFLAATGRTKQADAVLSKLRTMDLNPGVGNAILARHYRKHRDSDRATAHYRALIKELPDKARIRRQLIDYYLELNKVDRAMALIADSAKAIPADVVFSTIENNRELFNKMARKRGYMNIVRTIVADPRYREVAIEVLRIVDNAIQDKSTVKDTTDKLRRLADQNLGMLSLQTYVVDLYASQQRYEDAADLAQRTMQRFPTNTQPAAQAAVVLRQLGRWDEVLQLAQKWRLRTLNRPLEPDRIIADAYLHKRRPQAALDQLKPYIPTMLNNPQKMPRVASLYFEGLVQLKRLDEAARHLKPLIGASNSNARNWRAIWVRLAREIIVKSDPASALQWMKRAEQVTPANADREWANIATTYFEIAQRYKNEKLKMRSLGIFARISKLETVKLQTLLQYGVISMQMRAFDEAEKAYRLVLSDAKGKDNLTALNNLAILMAEHKGKVEEGLGYIERAVKAGPREANLHDTYASLLTMLKRYDDALAAVDRAIRLQPGQVAWKINKGTIYLKKGDEKSMAKAKDLLKDIEIYREAKIPRLLQKDIRENLFALREAFRK